MLAQVVEDFDARKRYGDLLPDLRLETRGRLAERP